MHFGPETVSLVWSAFRMVFTVCLSPVLHTPRVVDQIRCLGFSQGFATLRFFVRCCGPDFRDTVCMPGECQIVFKERVVMDDSKDDGDRVLKQIAP